MTERRWSVMLVPHDEGSSRSVSISMTVVKLLAGVGTVAGAFVLAATFGIVSRTIDIARSDRLERENQTLAREVARMNTRVGSLVDTMAVISRLDEQVRLVAGLEALDPDVRRAGVGGPAGSWPERDQLVEHAGTTGREALRVHLDLDALIRRANLVSASFREASDSLNSHVQRLAATPSIMPTEGFLTSNFSKIRYHPILHISRPHEGVDITAAYGTPIIAPAGGRVAKVGWVTGYGLAVEIDHGFGVTTRYAHQSRTAVRVGQMLKRGDRIGYVGSTGLSTGPHLHYEVLIDGRPTDPLKFVMPNAIAD
jgi:murein DD-endopeptidase MepM/ murein hydrolase activator NlpD